MSGSMQDLSFWGAFRARRAAVPTICLLLIIAGMERSWGQAGEGRPTPPVRRGAAPAGAAPAPAPAAPVSPWAEVRIKPELDSRQINSRKQQAWSTLQNNKDMNSPGARLMTEYFQLTLLPQLTQPDNMAKAPAVRDEIAAFFAAASKNDVSTEYLNDLVLEYMLSIVRGPIRVLLTDRAIETVVWNGSTEQPRYWKLTGASRKLEGGREVAERGEIDASTVSKRGKPLKNFHNTCRYNAMLVIGRLNERIVLKPELKETPLLKALTPMVEVAGDPAYPEAVRAAAMIGIRRHVEKSTLAAGSKDLICGVMVRVCKEKAPATGHLADGHRWIRQQAVELIGLCGTEGPDQAYGRALAERLVDPSEDMAVRQTAAAALAHVQPAKDKIKPGVAADLASKLASLAVDEMRYELEPAPQKQPPFSRQRAADAFDCVVQGLGGKSARVAAAAEGEAAKSGVLAVAPSNEQAYVNGLIKRVIKLRAECAKQPDEAELRSTFSAAAKDISAFAAAGPEAAQGSALQEAAGPIGDTAPKREARAGEGGPAAAPMSADPPF